MNIVLENNLTEDIKEKYMLVELDTFQYEDGATQKSFAVITKDEITLQDFQNVEMYVDLHNNFMKNYRQKNWKFCEDALDHLRGKFRQDLDSFYQVMSDRISQLKGIELPESWTPNVVVNK